MGSTKDTCEIYCFDEDKVNRIQGELVKEDLSGAAQLFKALADENRAKISYALTRDEELCVCDIANIIGATVATASHHLRTLHKQGIVKFRKEGKLAFYSLDDDHIRQLMMIALEHRNEVKANV
ncbi:metalloregulator ArsR/SmtB family transcription factor [Cytobacillus firmus]|uniref:Cadmium efflux system accessory protein n=1 Tax=Cytobacillus firmus TaxID=1399 RepID=A0A800MSW8_CYTFI|nr:metalloregulator ArsR/SmtB family transcription factor [Cytobacillus firmus]KAF0821756.1 Cadmium efflux system accessory protein [Cytobacillus firmus]MBG9653952.1 ArsR family transcriptional regulator [Cytobacillus firmus]MED1907245.1 metalloregulator ArsR/SmtB family transcription factor [Cytobacillus firmus]NUH84463.1 metalloregulator ArsR/SmtB family transcription factor [Cytobacillus firmus]